MRIIITIGILGAVTLVGCESRTKDDLGSEAPSGIAARPVARVGPREIGVEEVEDLAAADGMVPEAAVQRLIDAEVLAQEAERLGLSVDREAERAIERLMVRAMLHDMEEENTPESISEKELREDYALHQDKFRIPERRRSWHILVKDEGAEAKALAASILRELQQAKDPYTVYERYAEGAPKGVSLEVLAEELPPVTKDAGLEKPFKDELFGAKSEGPLKRLVETSYGWHAVVVAEILPAEQLSFADVEEASRLRISQAKRTALLVQTVQALKAEGLVHYDEEGVERLLSGTGLPERAD
ncbi:MAG: peptidylprolyl isomerase [Deltaproteobacteria bacterium]|nr:peptidylprolyl isomerase [Deltaproteobacteria bacterium]NND30105.1 peptidyl-prolyl cis-trans isomerase [Myxococcales bacterium]MBT8465057.1 peptidylprolyl isomerase [Deltaproteobacteria bacterium]MBT8481977.1 peptidylprolyl isomerase [Deltaproteobacteria bacterium]NNK08548.1 peptidyl-prolyl cis-trans isomerase [Myxococcales bacterium]